MANVYREAMDEFWRNSALEAGAQRREPTEREQLEKALAESWSRHPIKNRRAEIICEAARKHLETLPKPEPKFRIVGAIRRTGGRYISYGTYAQGEADRLASAWMATGEYNSVAVEQVSP